MNFNVSTKEASNTTVQRSQIQRKDDDSVTTWEKNKELWHLDSSRTLMIRRKFQNILFNNCWLHTEEQRRQNLFLHKQEDWQQHLILNMILQECRHDHAINTSRWYTDDAENYTCS